MVVHGKDQQHPRPDPAVMREGFLMGMGMVMLIVLLTLGSRKKK